MKSGIAFGHEQSYNITRIFEWRTTILKTGEFISFDGKKLASYEWDNAVSPKAVVQIIHGMAEHMGRYGDFASYLNVNGYIACGIDHRGHGLSAGSREKVGIVEGDDIFEQNLEDALGYTKYLEGKYKLPVIILGHSYGSFLAQRYMQKRTAGILGFVIMGSAYQKGAMLSLGKLLAKTPVAKRNRSGDIFAKLTFKSYDKKIGGGDNSWLTKDKEIVDRYNNDEYCNKTLSYGFYQCMFRGISGIYSKEAAAVDKKVPILIISGSMDGVGGYGKLVAKLYKYHHKLGYNSRLLLYDGARHEVLNETNRSEVYDDLKDFFDEISTAK